MFSTILLLYPVLARALWTKIKTEKSKKDKTHGWLLLLLYRGLILSKLNKKYQKWYTIDALGEILAILTTLTLLTLLTTLTMPWDLKILS